MARERAPRVTFTRQLPERCDEIHRLVEGTLSGITNIRKL